MKAVAAGAVTPDLNFQWLTASSESDPPQPILIFHKDTLPTIAALWQQPPHQVQRIIAKELMPTLYVNSLK